MIESNAVAREAMDVANEALTRIGAHEKICELRYTQINETMERIESGAGRAHEALVAEVGIINRNIFKAMMFLLVAFITGCVSLIVFIYLHPNGFNN